MKSFNLKSVVRAIAIATISSSSYVFAFEEDDVGQTSHIKADHHRTDPLDL